MAARLVRFFLACGFVFVSQAQPMKTLKVGLFSLKPHLYWESEKAQGASVDYLNEIAARTGYQIEWISLPFPRLQAVLFQGDLDCSLMMSKNEEREKSLVFASPVQFHVRPIFVVRNDSPLTVLTRLDQVKGMTIGYLEGANLSPFMRKAEGLYRLERLGPVGYTSQNLQKLTAGRIDAIFDLNHITYPYEAIHLGFADRVRYVPTPDAPVHVYVVASRRSEAGKAFLKSYSSYVQKNRVKYQTFLAPYLPPGISLD